MSAETHDSMSELVYLFVDGETTSAQEEILFNSMAGNPDLQQELQEAILIRSTLEQDCSALAVPPETTAAIFQKAGFSLPGTSSGLTVGSLIGSATQLLRSIALPSAFAIGGAAITTLYFMNVHDDTRLSESYAETPAVNRIATTSQVLVSKNDGVTLQQNEYATERNVGSEDIKRNHQLNTLIHPKNNNSSFGVSSITENEHSSLSENSTFDDNNVSEANFEDSGIAANSSIPLQDVSYLSAIQRPLQFNGTSALSRTELKENEFDKFLTESEQSQFIVSVRGFSAVETMPKTNKTVPSESFNNITLSLGYLLSEHAVVGLEGGSQSLQYYTFENGRNEKATLHNSMMWLGGYYRQLFPILEFSDIHPYAQVSLGGTLSGPTGRMITGLTWKPDARVSLSAGIEGSAFLYQNSAEWYSVRTLGFTYQVDVSF